MKKLVIASNNPGKLREIQRVLASLSWEVLPQSAFNIPEAEEPHQTFIENALAKARHASKLSGLPALADDSGICVDALNGAPGVYSAHYAGLPKSDERNNTALLDGMKNQSNRNAHYYCVLVMLRHADDPQPIIAEGAWRGEIAREPRGSGGFGYDPLFFLPELGKMSAELTHDEKNKISHRGKALVCLIEKIKRGIK
ncbi:MAG: RdgB/HAM1 family non-canonical purine NTP pyrophosphatase [Burkholderiales bacterium]